MQIRQAGKCKTAHFLAGRRQPCNYARMKQAQRDVRAKVRRLLETTGLSATELARRAGLAPSTLTRFLNGEVKHTLSSTTVARLVAAVTAGVTVGLPAGSSPARIKGNVLTVPELDVRAQGGGGETDTPLDGDGQHLVLAEWKLPADYLTAFAPNPSAVRIVRVAGDSMEPEYPSGDRVLVDTSHTIPSPPGVYVVWDGFGLVLKRLEVILGSTPPTVRLSSSNPAYAPYERQVEDVRVQGRVLGKWVWK